MRGRVLAGLLLLLLGSATGLSAQDSVVVINPDEAPPDSAAAGLPPQILSELLSTWNDSGTVRLPGGLTIPAGAGLSGKVAAFRGTMRIAGTFSGTLTVINGDLVVEPGGTLEGDVLVAGGRFTVEPGGTHLGEQRVYWDAAPLQRQSDGSLVLRERRRPIGELATAQKSFQT